MKLNKPSYGVFMVDIFASSVGIFILVSLLYIIESTKATSDAVLAERFKTLVKRDKIPVDRFSLPATRDPLQDWGIRARHAREKKEALILLLRDKILLYHTMQTLRKDEIVDSDAIRRYYDKYNKNHRLILEIHYQDAYHSLKAKIHESLPPDVHLWIHWAYNAGNITNPNPILGPDNTSQVAMSGDHNSQNLDALNDAQGLSSSVASGNARGNGTDAFGTADGKTGNGGSSSSGDDSSSQGSPAGQQSNGAEQGKQGSEDGQNPDQSKAEKPDDELDAEQQLRQEIARQMEKSADPENFVEQYLTPQEHQSTQDKAEQDSAEQNKAERSNAAKSGQPPQSTEDATEAVSTLSSADQSTAPLQQPPKAPEQPARPKPKDKSVEQEAEEHIKRHAFVALPLFSPSDHFQLNVEVPGYAYKRFAINAMAFYLHRKPGDDAGSDWLELGYGDAVEPLSSKGQPGWIQVKVTKVASPDSPLIGWVYGRISEQKLLLSLYENKVQSISTSQQRYWFKRQNGAIEKYSQSEQEQP